MQVVANSISQLRSEGSIGVDSNFTQSLLGCAAAHFKSSWGPAVDSAFAMLSARMNVQDKDLMPWQREKQLLVFDGCGPWGSPHVERTFREELLRHARPAHTGPGQCLRELEELYKEFSQSIRPPQPFVDYGPLRLIFTRPNNNNNNNSAVTRSKGRLDAGSFCSVDDTDGCSLEQLLVLLQSMVEDQHSGVAINGPSHLVFIMRSPSDLLQGGDGPRAQGSPTPSEAQRGSGAVDSDDQFYAEDKLPEHSEVTSPAFDSVHSDHDTAPKSTSQPPIPVPMKPLRGKHELLHGELGRSHMDTIVTPQFDDTGGGWTEAKGTRESGSPLRRLAEIERRGADPCAGAQAKRVKPTLDFDADGEVSDVPFRSLVESLAVWMRQPLRSQSGDKQGDWNEKKKVTLVSVGWENGVNFCLESSDLEIHHECLLPTRSAMTLAACHDVADQHERFAEDQRDVQHKQRQDLNRSLNREPSADGLNAVVGVKVLRALQRDALSRVNTTTEHIVSRIDRSLPSGMRCKLRPPSQLRSMTCTRTAPATPPLFVGSTSSPPPSHDRSSPIAPSSFPTSAPDENNKITTDDRSEGTKAIEQCIEASEPEEDVVLFLPVNKVRDADSMLSTSPLTSAPAVRVINGPHLVRVTEEDVLACASAVGYGYVTASLFEVPLQMDLRDCVSVMMADESAFKLVAKIRKRCIKRREIAFHFLDLNAFQSYCLLLSPWADMPHVAHFRTQHPPSSVSQSIVVMGVSDEDYALPSEPVRKLAALLDGIRATTAPVHLIHHASAEPAANVGRSKPLRTDLNSIYKRAQVVHTRAQNINGPLGQRGVLQRIVGKGGARTDLASGTDADFGQAAATPSMHLSLNPTSKKLLRSLDFSHRFGFGGCGAAVGDVHIVSTGRFLRMALCNDSMKCMERLLEAVLHLDLNFPLADVLTVFVHRPVVRFLQRRPLEGKWICDGLVEESLPLCTEILHRLLEWKGRSPVRDVQIFCLADVSSVQCVVVKQLEKTADDGVSIVSHGPDAASVEMSVSVEQSLLGPSAGDASLFESSADSFIPNACVMLRHILLPLKLGAPPPTPSIVFPTGPYVMGGKVGCELVGDVAANDIHFRPPRRDLYGHSIDLKTPEKVPYEVNILMDVEKFLPNESADALSDDMRESHIVMNAFHPVVIRPFVHELDLVDVVVGPVVGVVTHSTARVLFEINRDLRQLECVLRPIAFVGDEISVVRPKVKAFKVFTLVFEGLQSGRKYDILLPSLYGSKSLGAFRTISATPQFAQVAFTGGRPFDSLPLFDAIISQLQECQSPDLVQLELLTQVSYAADIAYAEEKRRIETANPDAPSLSIRHKSKMHRRTNTWIWLSEHLRNPTMPTQVVFHLGSPTLLPNALGVLIEALMSHGRRLFLPVRDANAIDAWYFAQFEELVKDTFRLVWAIPSVRDALAMASHLPMYTSHFLLPVDDATKDKLAMNKVDQGLMQVIRKVFESTFASYVATLYDWNPNDYHHGRLWKCGALAVVVLDVVTDRRRARKKKSDGGNSKRANIHKQTAAFPFSAG